MDKFSWCKCCGISHNVRRLFLKLVALRMDEKTFEYWVWNETPFPAAMPSWGQLFRAVIRG
jgi:hypothetical protein